MARRRSSARRSAGKASAPSSSGSGRRSSRAGAAASSGPGPKQGRDGKYEVACPQCSTVYKMPEQMLEAKFTCRNCSRAFFPKSTGGRRTAKARQSDTKPFIIGGVLLLGLIVVGVVISNLSSSDKNANAGARRQLPPPPPLGEANPRVKAGIDWLVACANNDSFRFANTADLEAMKARFGAWPERSWPSIQNREYIDLAKAILAAMAEDEDAKPLLAIDAPTSGSIPEAEALAEAGRVKVFWNMSKQEAYVDDRGDLLLDYRMIDGAPKITSYMWAPKPRGRKIKSQVSASGVGPAHEEIEAPTIVEREVGGQVHEIAESPIIALDHLEDTPAELRTEIDALVEQMLDHSDGRNFNRAVDRLKKIGRPAIPRLLNKINDLKGDLDGNNIQLSQVVRCLRAMTGSAFAYPVANSPLDPAPKKTEAERLSSLRAWFAFWYSYHAGDYEAAIKSDEELEAEFLNGSSNKKDAK